MNSTTGDVRLRSIRGLLLSLPPAFSLALLCAPARAGTEATIRASVSSSGAQPNADCFDPALSADGRRVAFYSLSSTLVSGDTNFFFDVFVRDLVTSSTTRVSVDAAGAQGNERSWFPAISADGRFVAFESRASNLVPGDTNLTDDVFVRDLVLGTIERVSLTAGGGQGNQASHNASVSADGRFVAWDSSGSAFVAGDSNGVDDVFVRDRLAGTTVRVSVASGGAQASGGSRDPSLSGDGRFVAFTSAAEDLVPGDTNGSEDVFVHDRQNGTTERVSVSSAGAQADDFCARASISADGRFVAFESLASTLVPGDANGRVDIFVHDRASGTTTRVSNGVGGTEADFSSSAPAISLDGRFVAFGSEATNLVAGDTNGQGDVFLHDRATGGTVLSSVGSAGQQGNDFSEDPAIGAGGRYVAFASFASNLVAGDTNNRADVFLRDRGIATSYCTAKTNSLGCTPVIDATGTPSAAAGSGFVVTGTSVLNGKFGLLLYSTTGPAAVPFNGGTLCLQGPLRRTPGQTTGGSPPPANDCSGSLAFDFNTHVASGVDPTLTAGARVWCQYYSRDPGFAPPENVSLTGGLEFALEP